MPRQKIYRKYYRKKYVHGFFRRSFQFFEQAFPAGIQLRNFIFQRLNPALRRFGRNVKSFKYFGDFITQFVAVPRQSLYEFLHALRHLGYDKIYRGSNRAEHRYIYYGKRKRKSYPFFSDFTKHLFA